MGKIFKLLIKPFGFGVPNSPLVEHVNPLFFAKVLQRCPAQPSSEEKVQLWFNQTTPKFRWVG